MKYKDRGDIKYVDFEKYNDMMLGYDENDTEHVIDCIMKCFYPNYPIKNAEYCVREFHNAFNKPASPQWYYKVDLNIVKASRFISVHTALIDNPIEFLKMVLRHKLPLFKVDINNVSIETANYCFNSFQSESLK